MNYYTKLFLIAATTFSFAGCKPADTSSTAPTSSVASTTTTPQESESVHPTTTLPEESEEAIVAKAISELPADEQAAATQQKYCAVQSKQLLGSMGMPYKIMIEGQPVYLCCAGCKGKATRNAEETLARVAELKAKNGGGK
jgi:hypothetical protein